MLLGAWRDGDLVGYACLYWTFTSLIPAETVPRRLAPQMALRRAK